jgi:hypothetical protein
MGLWDLGDGAPLIIDFREQNTVTTGTASVVAHQSVVLIPVDGVVASADAIYGWDQYHNIKWPVVGDGKAY